MHILLNLSVLLPFAVVAAAHPLSNYTLRSINDEELLQLAARTTDLSLDFDYLLPGSPEDDILNYVPDHIWNDSFMYADLGGRDIVSRGMPSFL